jgi:S1-C subfamily serine protease
MSTTLEQLNNRLADVLASAGRSLVQIHNGHGHGAGTVWHAGGLILTNAHVVGRHALRVTLPDGRVFQARLLAADQAYDLAALSVPAHDLPAIELGDSRELQPGQWVMAVGHPWGVAGAVTGGVVIGQGVHLPQMPFPGREWVAVSAPLRPGHSGGPLLDVGGRLVGINTMMAGPEVGLAVPVHVIKAFLRRAANA